MDDAGGGRRGRRAERSPYLDVVLEVNWGVRCAGSKSPDLGGSSSLNLLVTDGLSQYVARIYRPLVTAERLAILQRARSHLTSYGVPTVEPIPTLSGEPWVKLEDRLVELEPFVASTHRMSDLDRVQRALPLLGRMHSGLSELDAVSDGSAPVFSNYLPLQDLADSVSVGTRRIRAWHPTEREAELADLADRLMERVLDLELRLGLRRPEQLVHGDFWDNNVLFVGDDVVLVTDFDSLGPRPRVEDLALTLYFVSLDVDDLSRDDDRLWTLVDAYESGLDRRLAEEERQSLPIAMARQPLWSIGVWIARLDDETTARRHLAGTAAALEWGWQLAEALAGR